MDDVIKNLRMWYAKHAQALSYSQLQKVERIIADLVMINESVKNKVPIE